MPRWAHIHPIARWYGTMARFESRLAQIAGASVIVVVLVAVLLTRRRKPSADPAKPTYLLSPMRHAAGDWR